MFEKKIEALLISKRLITNSPRITDQNRCKFHSAALNAFKRSKSALNSLKSDFTVFSRKPSLNVVQKLLPREELRAPVQTHIILSNQDIIV